MKKMVILGAKESGTGAALLAVQKGYEVFISDGGKIDAEYKQQITENHIEFEEEAHTMQRILGAEVIIKSPGIPDTAEMVVKAVQKGIPVISEIEFASQFTNATVIGITGSNGKTSTTLLTDHIMRKAGLDVAMAGNVGRSFAGTLAEKDHDYFVLELSSFQLDGIRTFRPNVSVLLNITPDHLDRYDNKMERYIASKFRITLNQTKDDQFIYCYDDPVIAAYLKQHTTNAHMIPFSINEMLVEGGSLKDQEFQVTLKSKPQFNMSILQLALQGKHNLYNSMAATIATRVLDVRNDVIRESLKDFKNIEHRLEEVATVNGITFINDSKATNVNSTWYALETMKQPVIWIAGGVDKGNRYKELQELVKEKVKVLICLGADNEKLKRDFKKCVDTIVEVRSAKEAVDKAYELGLPNDVVLLSPACASFDLFLNYEDRGRQFKHAVRSL